MAFLSPTRTLPSTLVFKAYPFLNRFRRSPLRHILSPEKTLGRSFHDTNPEPNPNPNPETLHSSILQPIPTNLHPPSPEAETEEEATMNEFLSRFVHSIRGKLYEAYPGLPRDTRDSMLLIICQKVVARLDTSASADDPPIELSEDLWKTILDVSASVRDAMRRDRIRAELRKYLHCDVVKQMCRFAGEVGIRGDFLRELRFKWAREKLEEVEFYRELERMREQAKKEDDIEKGLISASETPTMVTALPLRKGKIRYKIYGLDMSDRKWADVSERLEEAEKHLAPFEAQSVVGRSKRVEERIMALDPLKDDLKPVFKEFEEALTAQRVDWLALLDRIKHHNEDLHFKAAELLLDEASFCPNIRDYSKLISAHSNSGRIQDAERILNKMTEKGIQPDALTSTVLVHMYSKAGNLELTKDAFEKLSQEGLQPDLQIYKSVITAYVNAGMAKQAEAMMREMEERDIKPTRDLYMQVLRAFSGAGQVEGARRSVYTMQFAGIQPDLESYKLLIDAYSQANDADQARVHFDNMVRAGIKPDDECAASMVAVYEKKNQLDKAIGFLINLEKDGFEPGIKTNTALIGWMARLQLVKEVEALLTKVEHNGEYSLEVHANLCDMYSRTGNQGKARTSLNILKERKSLLKANHFERIVSGLLAGRLVDDAERMFNDMLGEGFTPSESIKVSLTAARSIPRYEPGKKNTFKDKW